MAYLLVRIKISLTPLQGTRISFDSLTSFATMEAVLGFQLVSIALVYQKDTGQILSVSLLLITSGDNVS